MKRTVKIILFCVLAIIATSCMKFDDAAVPGETFEGTIIDQVTGKPFVTESGGVTIRLEELSWSDSPQPLDFGCKEDGTYFNSKIFKGHYRVTPIHGAFLVWADKTGKEIDIAGVTKLDLTVVPNLSIEISNFIAQADSFTVSCKITAANAQKNIKNVRVFVNNTHFVGDGQKIDQGGYCPSQDVNKPYFDVKDNVYTFKVKGLKAGRTFYMRVGARVDDQDQKYNYSEVKTIVVP